MEKWAYCNQQKNLKNENEKGGPKTNWGLVSCSSEFRNKFS